MAGSPTHPEATLLTLPPLRVRLLAGGSAPSTPVTPGVSWDRFQADVAGLSARLATRGVRRGGLWCKDGYAFAVGLLGLAQAGCSVVLPPGAQPGRLAEMHHAWDAMISDELADAIPPLAEPAPPPEDGDDRPCPVEIFTSAPPNGEAGRPLPDLLEREAAAWKRSGARRISASPTPRSPIRRLWPAVRILWPLLGRASLFPRCHDTWKACPTIATSW
jgi:hypothetical protein